MLAYSTNGNKVKRKETVTAERNQKGYRQQKEMDTQRQNCDKSTCMAQKFFFSNTGDYNSQDFQHSPQKMKIFTSITFLFSWMQPSNCV